MSADGKIYKGWFVLAGLMVVYAVSNGLVMHTLPILYPTLIEEFGWTSVQVTMPATLFFVVAALTSPPAGALLDRFSGRAIMTCGGAGVGLGLLWMSQVNQLWHMVGAYVLFALSLSLCGLVASMVILTRWFSARRGRATGMLLLASSFGGATFPWLLGQLMVLHSWRSVLMILGAIALLLIGLSMLFLVRSAPADSDGFDSISPAETKPIPSGPTLAATLRNPTFYFVAVATASVWFTVVPLIQHQAIFLASEVGVSKEMLPAVFSTFFIASMAGKLTAGWLGDLLDKNMTLILSVGVLVLGLVLLRSMGNDSSAHLYAYAVIAGIGFSGAFTTIQVLVANYFSGPSYGKILAIVMLIDTLAGGLGTRVIAGISDAKGTYIPAIDTMIGACLLAIVTTLVIHFAMRPQRIQTVVSPID